MAAQGLYWAVLPYCLRKDENFIPIGLCVRTTFPGQEDPLIAPLVERELWRELRNEDGDVDGYAYADADWQEIVFPEEEREKRREAAKLGGLKSAEVRRSKYGSAQPRSNSEPPFEVGSKSLEAVPVPDPVPDPVPVTRNGAKAPKPPTPFAEEIRQIFEVEVESRKGTGAAMLTSKRKKAGGDRLRQGYPLDEVQDAVRACCADDWCRKTANDNMAYALKDGDTLERFCRVWRQRQPSRRQLPPADEERGGEMRPLSEILAAMPGRN